MLRKLSMVCMSVVLGKGSVHHLVAMLFLSLSWLAMQIRMSPYRFAEDNSLKIMCEVVIFSTVTIALAKKTLVAPDAGGEYTVGLLVCYSAVPVAALHAVVVKVLRVRARQATIRAIPRRLVS